jgi:dihydropteroate synthase
MSTKIKEIKPIEYSINGKLIAFNKPLVMAIVNITPDSFYDGGKFDSVEDVLHDIEEKINSGADIIDIGAASTRPGAKEIQHPEEWQRLQPVLNAVRKYFPRVFISVDTYNSETAYKSANEGADIINDVSGGNKDDKMFETISKLNLPYVLMHSKGKPASMQENPEYGNVVREVINSIRRKIELLETLNFSKIIIDPGFGFGKTVEHNYQLLKHLDEFKQLGFPILAGVSRKSMINSVIGTNPVTALNGTTVLNTLSILNGASVLRVHDVVEAKQVVDLLTYYKNV